jgi:U6 snRNA-associated Sm-like protein LSm4
MLVELKNGETLNGHLVSCDTWMNLTLKEVVQTSPEGDRFFRLAEVYVRGNNVSLLIILRSYKANLKTDQIFESAGGNYRAGQGTAAKPARWWKGQSGSRASRRWRRQG